jgi:mutator protein MutT
MKFINIVKAVIVEDNSLLLIKRSDKVKYNPNTISLPGGHVEVGESIEDAIVREVKEETNLDVEVLKVNTTWNCMCKEEGLSLKGTSFLCKLLSDDVCLNEEIEDYKWINLDDVKKKDLPEKIVQEIEELKKNNI